MRISDFKDLTVLAGPTALSQVRDAGLTPAMIGAVHGAAGGPKWLVLGEMDRFLFGDWFSGRRESLQLVGASIGSWRFACAAQQHPGSAISRFQHAYIHQTYGPSPTPKAISRRSGGIIDEFLGHSGAREVFQHPVLRCSFLTVRCCDGLRRISGGEIRGTLLKAAAANMLGRERLADYFQQVIFHHPDGPPGFLDDRFSRHFQSFSAEHLRSILLASGSIPLVMESVSELHGAPEGPYWDGGLLDYHLDLAHRDERLVLFPHYTNRLVPGWFDKHLFWRRPRAATLDRMLMVAPSQSLLARLPYGKIPDRGDFRRFRGSDEDRFKYWWAVVKAGREWAASFQEALSSGAIRHLARAYPGT